MIINCINIIHRTDRRESATEQAFQQGVDIVFWNGLYDPDITPAARISRSHKQIVKYAKSEMFSSILIMEDDAIFTNQDSLKYFLENEPPCFDIYLASYYSGLETFDYRIETFRGLTLYKIHCRFFDKFLSLPEDRDIDYALDHQGEYFVCPKFAAIQSSGYSDKDKKEVDHSNYIPQERIFRGYP